MKNSAEEEKHSLNSLVEHCLRGIFYETIDCYDAYLDFLDRYQNVIHSRLKILSQVGFLGPKIVFPGVCSCCRVVTRFETFKPQEGRANFREGVTCLLCGLQSRVRLSMYLLERELKLDPDARIYLNEQHTRLSKWVFSRYPASVGSEFLRDGTKPGMTSAQGKRHEDLVELTFESEFFDAIISLEVFEHIPDFTRAFAECARVLRHGGKMLLSVPFHGGASHLKRAHVRANGEIDHLEPPEIHGDPINSQGILCFHHFGWDILLFLKEAGFRSAKAYAVWSSDLGFVANEGYQLQFIAQK